MEILSKIITIAGIGLFVYSILTGALGYSEYRKKRKKNSSPLHGNVYHLDLASEDLDFLLKKTGRWEVVNEQIAGVIKRDTDLLTLYNFDQEIMLIDVKRSIWNTYTTITSKKESLREEEKREAREHGLVPLDDFIKESKQEDYDKEVFDFIDSVMADWQSTFFDIPSEYQYTKESHARRFGIYAESLEDIKKERGIKQ